MLSQVIASFRTPFWTEEKRWLVICTWHPDDPSIEIYTSLVCTPNYLPSWHPNTITVTNFAKQDDYYTKYEDVLRLQIVSCRPSSTENTVNSVSGIELSAPADTNLLPFRNETDLSIAFDRWHSSASILTGAKLLNVRQLSISFSYLHTCMSS
jgi:hypothetical protein